MADVTSHEAPIHKAGDLPVDAPPKLIGRDTTLARVYTHLKENRTVLLYGASGIGKTAVAATLASAYTELPGGSLWLSVDQPTFAELIVRVGRAYNLTPITTSDNPTAFVAAAAAALAREKPLIVLDGRISAAVASEFVSRCAQGLPTLIVNEDDIDGEWAKFPLLALEASQAAALFRQAAELPAADPEAVNDLVRQLNFTPYALVLAAAHIRAAQSSPAEFRAALPPAGGNVNPTLLALTVVFKSLSNALQGLLLVLGATPRGEASAELIGMIGKAQPDVIRQAMGMLAARHLVIASERYGLPYYQLHPITFTFAQSWLRGSKRLETLQASVRDAVMAYARKYTAATPDAHQHLAAEMDTLLAIARSAAAAGDLDIPTELSVVLLQAGDFVSGRGYTSELFTLRRLGSSLTGAFPHDTTSTGLMAAITDEDLENGDSPASDVDEIDDEDEIDDDEIDELVDEEEFEDEDEIDELVDEEEFDDEDDFAPLPFDAPLNTPVSSPPSAAVTPLPPRSEPSKLESPLLRSVPPPKLEQPPRPTPLPIPEADDESDTLEPVEQDEIARLRTQIAGARTANDRQKQAALLMQLGALQMTRGLDSQATSTYIDALAALENLTDDRATLTALDRVTELTLKIEDYAAAATYAGRGANLADKLGDDLAQIRLLIALGDARQQLGESKDAVRAYERGLDVARTADDPSNEAILLYKLGYAHLDDSSAERAIETWEEALALFRRQERRDYEGRVLGGLGAAYSELERWAEAINFHTSALHIAREVKDREEELLQLSNLGYASVQARQLGQAVMRYRQALHLAYISDDKENIIGTSVDLARLLVESARHLSIADLLIDSALEVEPTSRDLKRLKERIEDERAALGDDLPEQASVSGSARDYAANAYALLDAV
ncbi:MAG: tetratricopeptide repeat protein [bacterium]|nr:tetratricopeptide repeat protein [bacterium]